MTTCTCPQDTMASQYHDESCEVFKAWQKKHRPAQFQHAQPIGIFGDPPEEKKQ